MQIWPLAFIKLTGQNASLRSHDRPEAGIFKIRGSCKLAVGSCKLSVGSCKLAVGSCKLAVDSCKLCPPAPQKTTGQNASLRPECRQSLTPLSDGGRADRRTAESLFCNDQRNEGAKFNQYQIIFLSTLRLCRPDHE